MDLFARFLIKSVVAFLVATGSILMLALVWLYWHSPGELQPRPGERSISEMSFPKLGGIEQFVTLEGNDRDKPLLLILHGGPGDPAGGLFSYYLPAIYQDFVVVNWDQRGAGRSQSRDIDDKTMTMEQLVKDSHQLTKLLRARFPDSQIYLLGHSWGTMLGVKLARDYPEDYAAYIGVGQVADQARSETLSYNFVVSEAKRRKNNEALALLEEISAPVAGHYADGFKGMMAQRKWVREFGGAIHSANNLQSLWKFVHPLVVYPGYRIQDKFNYLQGESYSLMHLEPEIFRFVPMDSALKFDIPVFIFQGIFDHQAEYSLANAYFKKLQAPKKKFVTFDHSAHMPFISEAEKFHQELMAVVGQE